LKEEERPPILVASSGLQEMHMNFKVRNIITGYEYWHSYSPGTYFVAHQAPKNTPAWWYTWRNDIWASLFRRIMKTCE
jgi:hypothetical protein